MIFNSKIKEQILNKLLFEYMSKEDAPLYIRDEDEGLRAKAANLLEGKTEPKKWEINTLEDIAEMVSETLHLSPINLSDTAFYQINCIMETFQKNGWYVITDYLVISPSNCKRNYSLMFEECLLKTGNIKTLWIACSTIINESETGYLCKEYGNYITSELSNMHLHPFRDQSAFMDYLKVNTLPFGMKMTFYLNTEFPNGYWENHIL